MLPVMTPVFLAKADIAPGTQPHVADLMARGLLSEEPTNSIACISCNAMVAIRRKGAKGELASALCPYCGATFGDDGEKPKGMHWKTYDRLCERLQCAEQRSFAGLFARFG